MRALNINMWLIVVGIALALLIYAIGQELGYTLIGDILATVALLVPVIAFWAGVYCGRRKMK